MHHARYARDLSRSHDESPFKFLLGMQDRCVHDALPRTISKMGGVRAFGVEGREIFRTWGEKKASDFSKEGRKISLELDKLNESDIDGQR